MHLGKKEIRLVHVAPWLLRKFSFNCAEVTSHTHTKMDKHTGMNNRGVLLEPYSCNVYSEGKEGHRSENEYSRA